MFPDDAWTANLLHVAIGVGDDPGAADQMRTRYVKKYCDSCGELRSGRYALVTWI